MTNAAPQTWALGQLALSLLAIDPAGLGGIHLRARVSPVRDAFLRSVGNKLGPLARFSPGISDTQLFGGIDIAATLSAGQVCQTAGLLAQDRTLCLTMAERCEGALAARLGQYLDGPMANSLILIDEGIDDEQAPFGLVDRLAFCVVLEGGEEFDPDQQHQTARSNIKAVHVPDDIMATLAVAAARFGVAGMRAPIFALRAARAHAVLHNRTCIEPEDVEAAVALVYAHRATMIPEDDVQDQAQPSDPCESQTDQSNEDTEDLRTIPDELLIEAVKAMLPDGILQALAAKKGSNTAKSGSGAGQRRKGNRRGRPLPSRPGKPGGSARIDVIATLRAAAPWQPIRRQQSPDRKGLLIRPSDIRVRQFQEHSDRLIIFTVDASGSSAMARLAEAKGAVELLLAEAYARRDHVALVAFRGDSADLLLPPTRSLVQTKRQLAALPGGGGTPLAAGLKCTGELAARSRSQGLTPSIAVLTDGRANVPLPGRTGRAAAAEDATQMARYLRAMGLPSAVIDTGNRPQKDLQTLSADLDATYLALPRADARALSQAVGTALSR